ncbi:MAG TPA: B-box zinc finger protein [Verrucomicrobiae bacterium]|nr:B-box zinc finger protein [Verrucomicrobiae bacterium]
MNCAVHTDVAATGYCRQCGKALCPECTRDVGGALYCESCLSTIVSTVPASHQPGASKSNPGVAMALGFIPGLGAVYNGEYVKALVHLLIFAGIIAALSSDLPGAAYYAFLGIALGCFYFYMPIEAYRVAKARAMGVGQPSGTVQLDGRKPMGAIVLIALGVLFLLANFGLLQKEWIIKGWPIGLVALGVWILMDRMKGSA